MDKKLSIWWDKERDFLELTIGKPRKGFFRPLNGDNDIWIRLDVKTKKPIGFSVINFSKHFNKKHKEIKLPMELELK